MWWLWIAGPVAVVVIYVLMGKPDLRRQAELARWLRTMGPQRVVRKAKSAYRGGKKSVEPGPGAKRLGALPGSLKRMVDASGGGELIGHYELAPRLAYLSVMGSNAANGSDFQAVSAKLEDAGPSFTVRPLPIVEGERVPNTGIQFKKDPDFMALFLVESATPEPAAPAGKKPASKPGEAAVAKQIRAWLSRPIREALLDFPEAWLSVHDKAMSLTLYGAVAAEKIEELVTTADVIFAEHGAEGGPSLLADTEHAEADEYDDAPPPVKATKGKGPVKGVANKRI